MIFDYETYRISKKGLGWIPELVGLVRCECRVWVNTRHPYPYPSFSVTNVWLGLKYKFGFFSKHFLTLPIFLLFIWWFIRLNRLIEKTKNRKSFINWYLSDNFYNNRTLKKYCWEKNEKSSKKIENFHSNQSN